jgi:GT2 family glycosyltransferase
VKRPDGPQAPEGTLAIPPTAHPLVSVVMVTYGGRQWVEPAVRALVAHTEAPFELIVVDNASTDGVQDVLRSIEGAKLFFNDRNVGFGPGVNQGVLHAVGRYVCMLNSDAFVEPGWLPPLIEVLETDPRAGAVVPRLLHLDGVLQEAGGVVGSDGSTRALGDGDDPEELQYRFRRYVDYGSAACLLMPRSAFLQIGGFDPAYPLGYCEDVDLCFALRERGLRTVYEPRSKVRHVRWGSSSRLEAERRVFANQPILLARWRERLAGRPSFADPPFEAHDVLQARDADAYDRILLLTDSAWGSPGPPSPRLRAVGATVAEMWPDARITMLLGTAEAGDQLTGPLLEAGIEVAAEKDWDAWMEGRRFHYSTVIVPGAACFDHFDPLIAATQPQATRVHDIERLASRSTPHLERWWPGLDGGPAGAMARRLPSLEAWGIESADAVLCATPAAIAFANAVSPRVPAFLVPGISEPTSLRFAERFGLAMVGDLLAGLDFEDVGGSELLGPLRSILAEIAAVAPDLSEGTRVRDGVASVSRTALLNLPIRDGAAHPARVHLAVPPFTGGSVLPSLGAGVPVVMWRGAAEGLGLALGELEGLLVADDAAGFARRVLDLHRDAALWQAVHEGLLSAAGDRFHPATTRRGLWSALAHCGLGVPSQVD